MKKLIWLSLLVVLTACTVKEVNEPEVAVNTSDKTINNQTETMTQKEQNQTEVTMKTSMGDLVIRLYDEQTPKTVENFLGLIEQDKYDDTIFHRVIDGFMVQGGDFENRNGTGGQSIWGKEFEDEIVSELTHVRGALSMANRGPNTNGSQFFIVHANPGTPHLNGMHTVFGQVVEGMDIVDEIAKVDTDLMDKPLKDVTILDITINE